MHSCFILSFLSNDIIIEMDLDCIRETHSREKCAGIITASSWFRAYFLSRTRFSRKIRKKPGPKKVSGRK